MSSLHTPFRNKRSQREKVSGVFFPQQSPLRPRRNRVATVSAFLAVSSSRFGGPSRCLFRILATTRPFSVEVGGAGTLHATFHQFVPKVPPLFFAEWKALPSCSVAMPSSDPLVMFVAEPLDHIPTVLVRIQNMMLSSCWLFATHNGTTTVPGDEDLCDGWHRSNIAQAQLVSSVREKEKAGSEEVRALQRSSAALQTETSITVRASTHQTAWTLGKAAKERRRRAPLRYPAPASISACG